MYFVSTTQALSGQTPEENQPSPAISFKEAVLHCLPREGGLFIPESAPDLRPFFLHMGEETTFSELAAAVTPLFFEGELNPLAASRVAERAFNFEPELVRLDETYSILNLYNGPTGVFKDFGISFLAALLEELLNGEKAMVVAAARGHTGAAIARAFQNRQGITTVLLYPDEPIYGLDSRSYVPQGGYLIPIRVKGSLDDCQKLVSALINDRTFAEQYRLTAANAINVGRLLPQSFYFLYSFIKLKKYITGELVYSIPSGNFGNLIAALYAWKFGMPVNGLIAAMNVNNSFGELIKDGTIADYHGEFLKAAVNKNAAFVSTITPVLDINYPSNCERLASFYKSAPAVMRNMVFPKNVDDTSTLQTMKTVWDKYGIHLDPHGAVAFAAAEQIASSTDFYGHIVVLSTAHPAKYSDLAFKASGKRPVLPEHLASLDNKAEPIAEVEPDLEGLESVIASYS
jgi:threonine synthase